MRSSAFPAPLCSVVMPAALVEAEPASAEKPGFPFEPQLEVLVLWEPTVVASDVQQHLSYELPLRDLGQIPGQRVRRVQELARLGNTGDSYLSCLHEVTTSAACWMVKDCPTYGNRSMW